MIKIPTALAVEIVAALNRTKNANGRRPNSWDFETARFLFDHRRTAAMEGVRAARVPPDIALKVITRRLKSEPTLGEIIAKHTIEDRPEAIRISVITTCFYPPVFMSILAP